MRIRHETLSTVFDAGRTSALVDATCCSSSAACRWSCVAGDHRHGPVLAAARARWRRSCAPGAVRRRSRSSPPTAPSGPPPWSRTFARAWRASLRRALRARRARRRRAGRARRRRACRWGAAGRRARRSRCSPCSACSSSATALLALVALAERPAARLRDVAAGRRCTWRVRHWYLTAALAVVLALLRSPVASPPGARPRPGRGAAAVRRLGQQPVHPAPGARPCRDVAD